MSDPLQSLLQQAADSTSVFAETSRYRHIETATGTLPDRRQITYLRRRFLPQPESITTFAEHQVKPQDRLDNLANQYLGDPELFWRICDANRAMRPADLTDERPDGDTPRVLQIGLPAVAPGFTGP